LGVAVSSVLLWGSWPASANPSSSPGTGGSGRAVVSIAAGGYSGYALLADGQVWAWGDDLEGQIGVAGQWYQSTVPVEVSDLSGAIAIAGGMNTAYALLGDGTVWAWGDDSQDELGAGDKSKQVPVRVRPLSKIVALDPGAFTVYALRRDGTVWAWGDDSLGQLGAPPCTASGGALSTCLFSSVPVEVPGIAGVSALASGFDTAYALLGNGTVWAWGDNSVGQLGSGTHEASSDTPLRVKGLDQVVAIAAGSETGYALGREGNVWAWGYGAYGQLGDASAANSDVPVRVRKVSHVMEIAGGGDMAYALGRDGNLWAWGYGGYGQLGDDSIVSLDVPVQVVGLPDR